MLDVSQVEEKIRNAIFVRRSRTGEYLKDFDRLRTGFITSISFQFLIISYYSAHAYASKMQQAIYSNM